MNIFFSSGEASGDAYAAEIATALRNSGLREAIFDGLGMARSRDAGISLVADTRSWGAMGVGDALRVAPRVYRGYRRALSHLRRTEPGLLIAVDFGYVNVRLCRRAKRLGWKTLYFIPPGCWRRGSLGKDLPEVADEIVSPFPWTPKAHFFGHPLLDMLPQPKPREERSGIAILPGSRLRELSLHLPRIAEATKGLDEPLTFGVAKSMGKEAVQELWKGYGGGPAEFTTDARALLARSRAGIISSGTATLEATLAGCPHVVMYCGTALQHLEYKLKGGRKNMVALPNLILQRRLVPELLQEDAAPEALRSGIQGLLAGGDAEQLQAFEKVRSELGEPGCIVRTAQLCQELLRTGNTA